MADDTSIRVLADITRCHAAARPGNVAMVFNGRESSYSQLDRRASQVANAIIAEGVQPQSRIAVLDKNSDSFFEVMFGSSKANTVFVAVNWRLAPAEIAYIINDASTELLFVGEEYFETVQKIEPDLKTVKKIVA